MPGDEGPAVAGQLAQLTELTGRDIARQGEAELTDAGQPRTVVDIGLLATNLFDVLGMKQFGVNAGVFQGLERGPSQKTPVPSMAAAVTPWARSQSVIARSPSGNALNSRGRARQSAARLAEAQRRP